ncbi:MAG: hypothetical protein KDA41_16765, partial [Planctomycetales bacterium]|nr:hypothetical protein [Planctomycetales bacterium]
RYRARLELTGRDKVESLAAAAALADKLDPSNAAHAQALAETLWVHQMRHVANEPLLRKVASSVQPEARAAAARALRYWHPEVKNAGALLIQLASDGDARVRAEAVVAATYYNGPDAAEVIFAAEQHPKDLQMAFVLDEARKSINVDQYIKDALAAGWPLSAAAELYTLRAASPAELMKLKPTEPVYLAILSRSGAKANELDYAVKGLAALRKTSELQLLVDVIAQQDEKQEAGVVAGAGELLLARPAGALQKVREPLRKFALEGKTDAARRIGFASWIIADASGADAFIAASVDPARLSDALAAIPMLQDNALRAGLYEQVRPLMYELPAAASGAAQRAAFGEIGLRYDYYQPNPPNVALESFDKLEPKKSGVAPNVTYNLPGVPAPEASALRFTGTIQISRGGSYTFYLSS